MQGGGIRDFHRTSSNFRKLHITSSSELAQVASNLMQLTHTRGNTEIPLFTSEIGGKEEYCLKG